MRLSKKGFMLMVTAAFVISAIIVMPTWADNYPTRPIEFVVTFAAGGSTDLTSRALAEFASKELGQPILVINKAGGGGSVGTEYWSSQKTDGYTIGIYSLGALEIQPHLAKVSYDPIKDCVPIMQYGEYPQGIAVKADSPFKTLNDLIEYARKNPEKVTYGTTGVGGAPHIMMVRTSAEAGIKWTHVPFKGGGPAITALLGGHIMATSVAEFGPHVKAGTLRLLAVFNPKRLSDFPDVPTIRELGYKITLSNYIGLGVPNGTPKERSEKLHKAFKKSWDEPSFKEVMRKWSVEAIYKPGDELAKTMREGFKLYGEILKNLGLSQAGK